MVVQLMIANDANYDAKCLIFDMVAEWEVKYKWKSSKKLKLYFLFTFVHTVRDEFIEQILGINITNYMPYFNSWIQ